MHALVHYHCRTNMGMAVVSLLHKRCTQKKKKPKSNKQPVIEYN
jgi:hypothetical protein